MDQISRKIKNLQNKDLYFEDLSWYATNCEGGGMYTLLFPPYLSNFTPLKIASATGVPNSSLIEIS